ncbi:beta-ketoacyl synthase N-terminal-like domain-containing protein [Streptomyces sp. NPDC050145]|uniref:beta-ketoacyl synthase N-terminal-like domain-containing protein n=1 Tax=Streptomyces sp. NPDC050145 TaxID=3365602 RepID=UPI00379B95F6
MTHDATGIDPNAIAVVGMACRFGPATSVGRLWQLLDEGRSGIRRHTDAELIALGHDPATLAREEFVPAGVVLEDADAFDAEFFGYSAQHAEWLDPQQRLLLEVAWHGLEDAGFAPDRTGLRTAAYVSVGQPTLPPVGITELDAAGMIRFSSSDKDFAATRVSYKLGLTGPSLTVQTACSSGLVGLHLAAESLLGHECDLAVVAAASLHFPQAGYLAAPGMILSPTGECRPFDDTADGTLFGNGGGALVLRRLADAVRDGDPVRAVLRGSAVNNDGGRKMDYHAPSPEGQEAVIREALAVSGTDPHSVGYLETHGTGTHLGDPVEFAALERVYGGERPHPAALGSVKSVLGHLNTAAGIAGVVKAVLALEHGTVPVQSPYSTPNRALRGAGGLRVADADLVSGGWPVPDGPRRAAVSSFGIGGTNAHVVLEQAPPAPRSEAPSTDGYGYGDGDGDGDARWCVLSAHTDTALRALAGELADAVTQYPLTDVAHTLRTGRSTRRVRAALPAASTTELADTLRKLAAGAEPVAPDAPEAYRAWAEGTGELPEADADAPAGRRVRLPGYPFARTLWPRPGAAPTRTVRPEDPVAADHVVAGRPVLPAAAQLDLALTAARRTDPAASGLADIAFHRPVEVTAPVTLTAVVTGESVRVLSDTEHAEARPTTGAPPAPAPLDLTALRAAFPDTAEPADLYRYFAEHGVTYGPAFQVLRELRHGSEGALARIAADGPSGGDTLCPYVLDGALQTVIGCVLREDLDGETFIPFAVDALTSHAPLPREAWVRVRPVRLAGGGRRVRKYDVTVAGPDGNVVLTLDGLALRPVPRTDGSSSAPRELPDGIHLFAPASIPFEVSPQDRLDAPLVVIGDTPLEGAAVRLPDPEDAEQAAATGAELVARLGEGTAAPVVVWPLQRAATGSPADALRLLALLKALLRPLSRRGAKILVPHPADALDDAAAVTGHGVAALGRSLAGENPRFEVTALALDTEAGPDALASAVRAAVTRAPEARRLGVARDGTLTTSVLRPTALPAGGRAPFRDGGRYWINGMGGLATLLARHLLDTRAAHLVLTGRSAATGERGAEIDRLAEHAARVGGSVTYHRLDSTDAAAVGTRAERIRAEGPVHGVLHCAGVLRDAYVLRKETTDAADVIAAKLTAATALDAATADWPLDFFVVYSSVSGALGSPGQADYAFANAAADGFVARRARLAKSASRSGRSLSVSWPYWAEGGMRTGPDAEQELAALGMRPMPTATGTAVLEALLGAPGRDGEESAPVVLYGDLDRLREAFALLDPEPAAGPEKPEAPVTPVTPVEPGPVAAPLATAPVAGLLEERLRAVVAEATRTPVEQVTPDRPFDDLGIDSLLAIRVVELLAADFGRLSKTLLFECRTVAELAEHLAEEFPERCAELTGADRPEPAPAVAEPPASSTAPLDASARVQAAPRSAPAAAHEAVDPRAVAIIGVAGRFPEADGLDAFWDNLVAGRDSITEVPRERWDAEALYDPDKTRVDRTYTKWGGFVKGVENFDAPLFSISPREAGTVDPQSRLFLESCWAALDDAGYTPDTLVTGGDPVHRKDVGVFVGAMYGEYQLHEAEERLRGNHVLANSAYWSIANRVSYFFDFQGPSTAVDTACSSALTAIHLAVESLRAGSSKVAIAGGVNVLIHPNKYFMLGQGRFAASDGRCRSFGAGGDGYVPGEGVGAFVLKPLADALRDGDHVHGVIRGTSVNHGGRTNGYTVPNPRAQADLVTKALRDAGLSAGDLDYVETHGTGTALGDPIEIRGLASAFSRDGVKGPGDLPIGSVKSNVGHLESAAGAVALAKVLLQMRHRTLVPSLHATPANPEIDFDRVPFTVQQDIAPWTTRDGTDRPLRAGISSFGAGGGNAHVVVEGPPAQAARSAAESEPVVVFLSARTDTALAAYAGTLRDALSAAAERGEPVRPADVAHTFAAGRADLQHRAAVAAGSLPELLAGLEAVAAGRPRPWRRTEVAADDPVRAWLDGGRIDRVAVCGAGPDARRVPLPHYPFERVRCWYDLQIERLHRQSLGTASPTPPELRSHLRDFGRAPQPAAPTPEPPRPTPVTEPASAALPEPPADPAPTPAPDRASDQVPASAPTPAPDRASAQVPASAAAQALLRAASPVAARAAEPAPTPVSDRASAQVSASAAAQALLRAASPVAELVAEPTAVPAAGPAPAPAPDRAPAQVPASAAAQALLRAASPAPARAASPVAATVAAPAPEPASVAVPESAAAPATTPVPDQASAQALLRAASPVAVPVAEPASAALPEPPADPAPTPAPDRASAQVLLRSASPAAEPVAGSAGTPVPDRGDAQVSAQAPVAPAPVTVQAPATAVLRPLNAAPTVTNTTTPQEASPMTRARKISLRPLGGAVTPAPAPVPASPPPAPRPASAPPAARKADQVAEDLRDVLAGVLYMEPADLDPEHTFQTLGVDSILSVEFIALVNARFGTDLKATELYDHPTPSAFARRVAGAVAGQPTAPVPAPAAPATTPADGTRSAAVLETLREQLAETLYCDVWDVDVDATFNALGLDSILGVEFVAFLNNAYGLDEKAGVLYDHPSLTALAAHIAARSTDRSAPAAPAAPSAPAPAQISAADLDALLGAVRDNRMTVEQALSLLPQHS